MKPYLKIPIEECGEPLVAISRDFFAFFDPHPYVSLGAPYGATSPWMLRQGVVQALKQARVTLQEIRPGWKLMLFDAYRPNAVQAFMVEHEFALRAKAAHLDYVKLTPEERERLAVEVFRIWGFPSESPTTPPPHSTGGALDCTLANELGFPIDMGSPIDENSDRSYPDHFATATDQIGRNAHMHRELLCSIMRAQGFHRHKTEWWHFSYGDQYWAWIEQERVLGLHAFASYGRADLLATSKRVALLRQDTRAFCASGDEAPNTETVA